MDKFALSRDDDKQRTLKMMMKNDDDEEETPGIYSKKLCSFHIKRRLTSIYLEELKT